MSARHRKAKQAIREAQGVLEDRTEIVESYDRAIAHMSSAMLAAHTLSDVRRCRNLADQHRQDAVEHLDELLANFLVDFPKLADWSRRHIRGAGF